jgi:hypothetical protein
MAAFSNQIDDYPVSLTNLNVASQEEWKSSQNLACF